MSSYYGNQPDPEEAVAQIARDAAAADPEDDDVLVFTTSTEYRVRVHPIKPMFLRMFRRRYRPPEPPMQTITQGGKSWEQENKDDPEYLDAVRIFAISSSEAMMRLMVLWGVDILDTPEGAIDFEHDKEFRNMFATAFDDSSGVPVEETALRYEWMLDRVFPSAGDVMDLTRATNKILGIDEEDVASEEETFRRALSEYADQGVAEGESRTGTASA